MFLLQNLPIYLGYWLVVIVIGFACTGTMRYNRFRFSVINYYIFTSVFVLPVLIESIQDRSLAPLVLFAGLGLCGVVGETIASAWWHLFFGKRFWSYEVETIFHKYTSWLNFIPWAVGGLLYLGLVWDIVPVYILDDQRVPALLFGVSLVSILLQLVLFHTLWRGKKFHEISVANVIFFFAPMVIFVCVLASLLGNVVYVLAFSFGLVATVAEYLFGKATQFLISKKMWTYNYMPYDVGHFTPLSIPFFILGGFYFWSIAIVLHLI